MNQKHRRIKKIKKLRKSLTDDILKTLNGINFTIFAMRIHSNVCNEKDEKALYTPENNKRCEEL